MERRWTEDPKKNRDKIYGSKWEGLSEQIKTVDEKGKLRPQGLTYQTGEFTPHSLHCSVTLTWWNSNKQCSRADGSSPPPQKPRDGKYLFWCMQVPRIGRREMENSVEKGSEVAPELTMSVAVHVVPSRIKWGGTAVSIAVQMLCVCQPGFIQEAWLSWWEIHSSGLLNGASYGGGKALPCLLVRWTTNPTYA